MKQIFLVLLLLPCLLHAQSGSEIYLFDLVIKDGKPVVSNGKNITHHKGYDNQPSFHPSSAIVYYASFNDSGRSDIRYYNYKTEKAGAVTVTNEREYSPTVTPDGKYLSCIIQRDNGAQDLGKYPIGGGEPIILISTLKVGYHVWLDAVNLLLFVLEDSGRNSLHHYQLETGQDKIIVNSPGRSLHAIPGTKQFSFIHKEHKDSWKIRRYDPAGGTITDIAPTLTGREDITWLSKDLVLSSDGNTLFYLDLKKGTSWEPIQTSGLKGISRLAFNRKAGKLAVVVAE